MVATFAMEIVRWHLPYGRASLWHLDSPTLSNTQGRTGCGKRYPRHHAALLTVPAGTDPADHIDVAGGERLCKSCLRAYVSEGK